MSLSGRDSSETPLIRPLSLTRSALVSPLVSPLVARSAGPGPARARARRAARRAAALGTLYRSPVAVRPCGPVKGRVLLARPAAVRPDALRALKSSGSRLQALEGRSGGNPAG